MFNRLQELDEKRILGLKEFIKASADIESSVAPIIARCLEGIQKASESINEKEDSMKVIERYVMIEYNKNERNITVIFHTTVFMLLYIIYSYLQQIN